jgi:HlyD family secretion protein
MQVETAIDESDVGRIVEGMPATFTVDAFPGKVFQSQVKQVRKAPINVQNVITYTVLLSAQNNDLKLLPGMTANTSIITEQKEKVLRIPNAALRFKMPNTQPGANNQFTKNDAANPSRGSSGSGGSGNSGSAGSSNSSNIASASAPMTGKPSALKDGKVSVRKVWVLEKSGLKEKPVQKTIRVGLSDGNVTEVLPGEGDAISLKPGDRVIVGFVGGAGKASASRPTGPRLF